jgi:hypothetical protein
MRTVFSILLLYDKRWTLIQMLCFSVCFSLFVGGMLSLSIPLVLVGAVLTVIYLGYLLLIIFQNMR